MTLTTPFKEHTIAELWCIIISKCGGYFLKEQIPPFIYKEFIRTNLLSIVKVLSDRTTLYKLPDEMIKKYSDTMRDDPKNLLTPLGQKEFKKLCKKQKPENKLAAPRRRLWCKNLLKEFLENPLNKNYYKKTNILINNYTLFKSISLLNLYNSKGILIATTEEENKHLKNYQYPPKNIRGKGIFFYINLLKQEHAVIIIDLDKPMDRLFFQIREYKNYNSDIRYGDFKYNDSEKNKNAEAPIIIISQKPEMLIELEALDAKPETSLYNVEIIYDYTYKNKIYNNKKESKKWKK